MSQPTPFAPSFERALRDLDYRALAELRPETACERYVVARARIVLGEYDAAQSELGGLASSPSLHAFLSCQLHLYRREDLNACVRALCALKNLPDHPYFHGEYHFVLGYLHHLLDEYQQGSRQHWLARDFYLAAGLPAQAAVAVFNLCVGSNYLNAREHLEGQLADLRELTARHRLPATEALWRQFEAYRCLEREEWLAALAELRSFFLLSQLEGRRREVGIALWLSLYAAIKLGDERRLAEVREAREGLELTAEHGLAWAAFEELADCRLLDAARARERLLQWKQRAIDSVPYFFLVDLLLESLLRAQEYEEAALLAARLRRESLRSQRALALFDYRYVEGAALQRLGQGERASLVLAAYRADAAERGAHVRVAKADAARPPVGAPAAVEPPRQIVLNTLTRELKVDGQTIALARQPRLYQLLAALIEEGGALPVGQLFFRLYGTEFHPLRHESRFNSLVGRLRGLFGSEILRRVDSTVALLPEIQARLEPPPTGELRQQWRRRDLLTTVRGRASGVTISELEKKFECTRRTLQLDLDLLVREGALFTNGGTRGRRYFGAQP